jgi:nucleoside 2-deoxyribosyltransferase
MGDTVNQRKIYLASSWKQAERVREIAQFLRRMGHEVDCFCDDSGQRFVFHFSEIDGCDKMNAIEFLKTVKARRAFQEDRRWIDWSDCVVLILPCGKSAHLEAGYAKGQGKKLIIYGEFPKGEFDVMYGFADAMVEAGELSDLLYKLETEEAK